MVARILPGLERFVLILSKVIKGDQQPKDDRERLQLAQRAYDKGIDASAAKLWAEAFESDPTAAESRAPQNRYNAACAAALAGCGQGKDEPAPDDLTRTKLRGQALGWLQAEVGAWSKIVASGPPQAKDFVAKTLAHWKEDSDLAGIREAAALEKLPEAEREKFRALWSEVEALQNRAEGKP